MRSFRWLHFSDLHIGSDGTSTLWSNFQDDLKTDLSRVHSLTGNWDVVFITGDIAFSGRPDQFEQATDNLRCLWEFFRRELGFTPPIFCVPGNHDLRRPNSELPINMVLSNMYWSDKERVRKTFWDSPNNDYRQLINDCFRNYSKWFEQLPLPKLAMRNGILPGDISAKAGTKLQVGLVGLNSAFLHLNDRAESFLDLHEKQLVEVCGGDPPGWCATNELNFILTHHGQDWLHKRAQERYRSELYNPDKFYAHLFGHMHTPATKDISEGGSSFRRFRQAPSLFGLTNYGSANEKRCHGYNAGVIHFTDDEAKEHRWSRITAPQEDGRTLLGPEQRPDLNKQDESVITFFRLGRRRIKDGFSQSPSHEDALKIPDLINQIRKELLRTRNYLERLEKIHDEVLKLWKHHHGPPWEIFHNNSHNIEVEKALYELIPEDKRTNLSEEEWFSLIASVWFHDIGMIVGLPGFETDREKELNDEKGVNLFIDVRQQHNLRSATFVRNNWQTLGISEREADSISTICKFHRRTEDINVCPNNIGGIRIALLSAYLRVAVTIHLDQQITSQQYQELLQSSGMDWESMFHWMKAQWITSIKADPERLQLILTYLGAPEESDIAGFVSDRIKNELDDTLKSVLLIMLRGKISYFLDVSMKKHGFMDAAALRELELIRGNIHLEELSSASEAYVTVLNTLLKFTAYPDPLKVITRYVGNISHLLKIRPCHNMIRNLLARIEPILAANAAVPDETVATLREIVSRLINEKRKNTRRMRMYARPFLTDRGSILLYGYSSSVIDALSSLSHEDKQRTKVYIGECRGKSQFDRLNLILYNDGINYAENVKKLGFTQVQIIPDISIGNLMKRNLIQKVFFGANGIDIKKGSFGHTCGHLTIADLAKEYKVPVYVIAETSKFGELKWDKGLNRDINWLTNDPNYLSVAQEMARENPREDQVEPEKINTLITEIGAFPPARIPERIKAGSSES